LLAPDQLIEIFFLVELTTLPFPPLNLGLTIVPTKTDIAVGNSGDFSSVLGCKAKGSDSTKEIDVAKHDFLIGIEQDPRCPIDSANSRGRNPK